jgi:hypothetical protein
MGGEMAHVISAADNDGAAPILRPRDVIPCPRMQHGVEGEYR